jgi:hypothetical protein
MADFADWIDAEGRSVFAPAPPPDAGSTAPAASAPDGFTGAALLDDDAALLDDDVVLPEGDAALLDDDAETLEDGAALLDDDVPAAAGFTAPSAAGFSTGAAPAAAPAGFDGATADGFAAPVRTPTAPFSFPTPSQVCSDGLHHTETPARAISSSPIPAPHATRFRGLPPTGSSRISSRGTRRSVSGFAGATLTGTSSSSGIIASTWSALRPSSRAYAAMNPLTKGPAGRDW